jgi:hypothetical protein
MTLCTLADVKTMLDISDTSQDGKLNLIIEDQSAYVERYLGYPLAWTTYTDDIYPVNNNQLLYLRAQPIQSVASVTLGGMAVTDYVITPQDGPVGGLYYGSGWSGNYYTRGMTYDPVAGFRDIKITWTGGWYLPGNPLYVKDDPKSLPLAISKAVRKAVIESYRLNMAEAEGLKSYSEGGISMSWDGSDSLSQSVKDDLATYKRWVIA